MLDPATMTWTCMVCREERPDAQISVAHRQVRGMESRFPDTRWNVRYCNDRPHCAAVAQAPGVWIGAYAVAGWTEGVDPPDARYGYTCEGCGEVWRGPSPGEIRDALLGHECVHPNTPQARALGMPDLPEAGSAAAQRLIGQLTGDTSGDGASGC